MHNLIYKISRNFSKTSFKIAGLIGGAYALLALIIVGILIVNTPTRPPMSVRPPSDGVVQDYGEGNGFVWPDLPDRQPSDSGSFLRPPARTSFMFVGLDNNLLTDAIMVGTFYRDSGNIHLMSIPRDMYTRIPTHRLETMRADGLRPPTSLKINAMRAFGGRQNGIYYLKDQLGEMLGVQFDYYVEVELTAFKRIVDAIGGVTMHIPQRLFYEDPEQGLFINIPPGEQHLTGAMAEGVVRFRSFPTGDLQRNNMQMEFMSQLMRQVLTRDALMNDPMALFNIIRNDVNTNAGLEMARFIPYIGNISGESITTFVMPGNATYINGISFFMPDSGRLPDIINEVFYANPENRNLVMAQ